MIEDCEEYFIICYEILMVAAGLLHSETLKLSEHELLIAIDRLHGSRSKLFFDLLRVIKTFRPKW